MEKVHFTKLLRRKKERQ